MVCPRGSAEAIQSLTGKPSPGGRKLRSRQSRLPWRYRHGLTRVALARVGQLHVAEGCMGRIHLLSVCCVYLDVHGLLMGRHSST